MTTRVVLVLPDAWRLQLFLSPQNRRAWLDTLGQAPGAALLDWESLKFAPGDTLASLGIDLAAAELILKVPESVRVVAVGPPPRAVPLSARSRFLLRAAARVGAWLPAGPYPLSTPAHWLPQLVQAAGAAR